MLFSHSHNWPIYIDLQKRSDTCAIIDWRSMINNTIFFISTDSWCTCWHRLGKNHCSRPQLSIRISINTINITIIGCWFIPLPIRWKEYVTGNIILKKSFLPILLSISLKEQFVQHSKRWYHLSIDDIDTLIDWYHNQQKHNQLIILMYCYLTHQYW